MYEVTACILQAVAFFLQNHDVRQFAFVAGKGHFLKALANIFGCGILSEKQNSANPLQGGDAKLQGPTGSASCRHQRNSWPFPYNALLRKERGVVP